MIKFHKLDENLSNIDDILRPVRKLIKSSKKDISLDKKNIAVANVEQPSLMAYYDEVKSEVKHLVDYSDILLRKKRGELYKHILESLSKSLNDRALDKLIDSDDEYIELYKIHLDVKEVYDKMHNIVNSFSQRSFSLNNLVKIYENQLNNITIHT